MAKDYSKGNVYGSAENARALAMAITALAKDPERLQELESYLSYHFSVWMEKYANDADNLVSEFLHFAKIEDPRTIGWEELHRRIHETEGWA